ncbi:tetratricopeptide repeat protein 28-like [Orbicella faveolata]|uniref:tetratricopeptide repeat protein 28-like n=1 Tax=Orbicella faveolata TaxID=48498 RepID=UPI0009E411B9|nr:tetratricopeptide repeat protein 28-like [Orbicella faveolata]
MAMASDTVHLWLLKGKDVHFEEKSIEDATLLIEDACKEIGRRVRINCENRSLCESAELQLNKESFQGIVDYKDSSLRVLFDSTIGTIANMLDGDELIIVLDGPLCLVPYAACVDETSRYLSESTSIRILPSLTSLKLITECPEDYHSKVGALLVGDPCVEEVKRRRGKRVRLSCLPGAREEVKMIGEILNTEPLTGRDATKDEVLKRIGSVTLVHIAAHGDMKAGEIALAPNPARTSKIPKDKDYLLTMSDVKAVQLRASLVVLSCFHSAQGKVTADGVVGIGRAFMGAGARSVLVSLWAIDDEATMEFMKHYKQLDGGCKASVALNRAMKCLRESERFGAVKHWPPFVLIGDDVTIDFGKGQ